MSDYIGIDYSRGQSNFDPKTGIHYGVINMHALSEWAWEDFEADYGDPTCPKCGNEVEDYTETVTKIEAGLVEGIISEDELSNYHKHSCADYVCTVCGIILGSDEVYGDEPLGWYIDDNEYKAWVDGYNDVMLVKSPYYTEAQYCSPCAPGAGHLGHPVAGGPKTYCFARSWFTDERCPYPYWSVATGELVYSPDNNEEEDT